MSYRSAFLYTLVALSFLLSACGGGQAEGTPPPAPEPSATPSPTPQVANESSSVISTKQSDPDEECPNGGLEISSGIDENGNGLLDEEEIDAVTVVCHGTNGEDGEDGDDGQNGEDGSDGYDSLIRLEDEAAGENCIYGGIRIESGQDLNRNSVLDAEEVSGQEYICEDEAIETDSFTGLLYRASVDVNQSREIWTWNLSTQETTLIHRPFGPSLEINFPDLFSLEDRIGYRGVSQNLMGAYVIYAISLLDDAINHAVQLNIWPLSHEYGGTWQWSPDGSKAAYLGQPEGEDVHLYVVESDGTGTRRLSENYLWSFNMHEVVDFEWSPNSDFLIYSEVERDEEGVVGAMLYNVDVENLERNLIISSELLGASRIANFKLSEDGSGIAYSASFGSARRLYGQMLGDTAYKVLGDCYENCFENVFKYSWSPTSNDVLYRLNGSVISIALCWASIDDDDARCFANRVDYSFSDFLSLEWSPDGQRIAYEIYEDDIGRTLYSIGIDELTGSLIENNSDGFRWSPDSSSIAARVVLNYAPFQHSLNIHSADGSRPSIPLNYTSFNRRIYEYQWSPSSKRIAYRSEQDIENVAELFLADLSLEDVSIEKISGDMAEGGGLFTGIDVDLDLTFKWDATGDYIAYRANQRFSDLEELFVVNIDTGDVQLVQEFEAYTNLYDFYWISTEQ